MKQKSYHIDKVFCDHQNFFQKNVLSSYNIYFQYRYAIERSFYLKLDFTLKIDHKTSDFKNFEEILKLYRSFPKTFGNPVISDAVTNKLVEHVVITRPNSINKG